MINNYNSIILLIIFTTILLSTFTITTTATTIYNSHDDSDNDGNNKNNEHYSYEKSLAFKNSTFIENSINCKPTILYYTYKITPYYSYGYIGSNEIKNHSSTHVPNAHIPIDDLETPFEIVMAKSHNTMIVTGVSDTKKNKFNGCQHYFDYGDIRVEDCKMWINLIDVSQNERLSHYSIHYLKDDANAMEKSKHIVIGMDYHRTHSTFCIVSTNDYFYIDGSVYSNSNQNLTYYETEIVIEPMELDGFKMSHDKLNNIYYSYVKEIGTAGNHYIVMFNGDSRELKVILYTNPMKLNFQQIGIAAWNGKFVISNSDTNKHVTNVYTIDLSSLNSDTISASTKLVLSKPWVVSKYVKSENSRYFMFYNKPLKSLTLLDLNNNQHENYTIDLKLKVVPYSELVEIYAFYQDPSNIQPTKTDGIPSGKLFIIIFYPIFGFAMVSIIVSFIVLTRRKSQRRKLLLETLSTSESQSIKQVSKEKILRVQEKEELEELEKEKQFLEIQKNHIVNDDKLEIVHDFENDEDNLV